MLNTPPEIANIIAIIGVFCGIVGAFCGIVGGGIAFYNSRKSVQWKRAELANNYFKDFYNNPELVFACRCLDWNAGRLPLPQNLQGIIGDAKFIDHDRAVFREAMRPDLKIDELDKDERIQIYRIAIDAFLSWLGLVAGALDRKLFVVKDIEEVGYWLTKIQSERVLHAFIVCYGYQASIENLIQLFREEKGVYQRWVFPTNTAGLVLSEKLISVSAPEQKPS